MNKKLSLPGLCLLSSLLAACVSIPEEHRRPVVVMNSAIRLTPDSEFLRGKLLHLQSRYDEAQQAYLSALTMDKDHPEARNGLAALLGARGDLDRSIALLTDMAQSGTRLPQVYVNLGHAWLKKGQWAQARTALERALEMDPDNQAAQEKIAALRVAENPASAQLAEQVMAPDAATATAVVPLNAIEALGEGLYVLRYTLPVSDIVDAPAQRLAGAAQDKTVTHLIEQTTDLTPVSVQSDLVVNWVPSGSVPSLAIEVANGNGVQGLARSLRRLMAAQSWRVVRTTNHQPFGVRFTRIEYAWDRAQDARTLADTLGINAKFRLNNQQTGTQLRIILGHDLKDLSAIRQRFSATAETTRTSHVLEALPEMHSSVH